MWGARTPDRFLLRRGAELRGRRSEVWAALLLSCKLYRVLGWRVKTRLGELDLVALSPDGVLCFIEVKARRSRQFGAPEDAITPVKRKQIRQIARGFVHIMKLTDYEARFDVVAIDYVTGVNAEPEIRHHIDAFR